MTHSVALVTRRELIERLRARSFLVSTSIYLLVALASVVIPQLAGEGGEDYDVAVTGSQAGAVEQAVEELSAPAGVEVRVRLLADESTAAAAVRADDVDVALVDGRRLIVRGDISDELRGLLSSSVYQVQLAERLRAAGLDAGQVGSLLTPQPLEEQTVTEERPVRSSNRSLAFAGIMVIYLLLLTYGFTVANGVLEEKSSRVSEVLLGALHPSQLLAGKVVGIGLVAVTQLLLIGIPTAVVALAVGSFSIPDGTPLTLAAVLLWALLGYGLYSCVFAAAGAAASRPEDMGNATAPITILIALTYFAAVACVQEPDSTVARVVSFIPFMSPMTMLPRASVGHVAWWEVPVAVALVLVTTYGTVRLGARIYAGGIRRHGPRLKVREAWRAASG